MLEIYAFRHGQTDYNVEKRFQGQLDIPLNDCGIKEAERVAQFCQHIPFSFFITSDLLRCTQMVGMVNQYQRPQRPVLETRFLRERYLGRYEGQPYSAHPLGSSLALKAFHIDGDGGESFDDVTDRMETIAGSLDMLCSTDDTVTVGLFSHGGCLNIMASVIQEKSFNPDDYRLLGNGQYHHFKLGESGKLLEMRLNCPVT